MTKFETIRSANMTAILSNKSDQGRFGRAFELSCTRTKSRKTTVAAQGRVDNTVKVLVNGKVRYMPVECKTNGGRIDDLITGKNKSRFVVYRLETTLKHKASKKSAEWIETRSVDPVIIPTDLFLEMLRDCNAIKNMYHNGELDGMGIQVSSKKMYERLLAYSENYPNMVYDPEETYEDWDFEGLEL